MSVSFQYGFYSRSGIGSDRFRLFQEVGCIISLPMPVCKVFRRHVRINRGVAVRHLTVMGGNPFFTDVYLYRIHIPDNDNLLSYMLVRYTVLMEAYLDVIGSGQLHFLSVTEAEGCLGEFTQT